ncbi:hypothetical protein KFZ70_14605 [Tamlana fucoidanivorans]|uniref:DUF4890 domain-containing protein n=1 Tax=Allotamlana fucoidanivorans TaxID=2583814 RepID=A0A5C4SHD0_9FLAO|nr:hypothetical protein [Tamlana fucoidanivorans]TNJ42410.1 hypothetical protein FGF67_14140 [Tamlana fucoidanivorans]
MKKIVFTLLLIVAFASSYGQSKWHKQQNQIFVDAAAKEYGLDDSQKEKLYDVRLDMVTAYMDSNKAMKAGDITKEEMRAKNKEASETFHTELAKITGKPYKEMKPWLDEMREKMNKK